MGLALQNKKLTAIAIAPFHSKAIALPTLIKSDRSLVEYKNKERSPKNQPRKSDRSLVEYKNKGQSHSQE